MRSVVDDRAESAGAQQVAAIGPQIPQARISRKVWPAIQVPLEAPARAAGIGDEVAYRALVGDLAEPTTAEPARPGFADVSQRGLRSPEDSTTVSVVSMPGGTAAQAVGDGQ